MERDTFVAIPQFLRKKLANIMNPEETEILWLDQPLAQRGRYLALCALFPFCGAIFFVAANLLDLETISDAIYYVWVGVLSVAFVVLLTEAIWSMFALSYCWRVVYMLTESKLIRAQYSLFTTRVRTWSYDSIAFVKVRMHEDGIIGDVFFEHREQPGCLKRFLFALFHYRGTDIGFERVFAAENVARIINCLKDGSHPDAIPYRFSMPLDDEKLGIQKV